MVMMKLYGDYKVPAYTSEELESFKEVVIEATHLWKQRCDEYQEKNGDIGPCVIGAGIKVYVKYPRRKVAVKKLLIYPPSKGQGSCIWEASQKEVVNFLKSRGLDCFFEYGRMD